MGYNQWMVRSITCGIILLTLFSLTGCSSPSIASGPLLEAHLLRLTAAIGAARGIAHAADEPILPKWRPPLRLLAVGDVNLGRTCGERMLAQGLDYPFAHLKSWIESYDIAFCNLECPISDQNGETFKPGNRLIFTAPQGAETAVKNAGWDIVATANNHCRDYGISALEETIRRLDAAGVPFNGTAIGPDGLYKPTYIEAGGYKLAFIAVTDIMNGPYVGTSLEQHLNWADKVKLLPAIKEADANADFVLLSYHGGIEYTPRPTESTREFLRWAVDNGVDVVLGHHPHFFQTVEWYKDGLIIYSMGNFTFFQGGWMEWTDYGMAASITLGDEGIGAQFIPIRADYQAKVIKDEALKKSLLERLKTLSGGEPSRFTP